MVAFVAYVAGPVLRPGRTDSVGPLYAALETAAKARDVQLALPLHSEHLDGLPAPAFAKDIRDRIRKADVMIAVIVRPAGPHDLSGYSIAVEAHEAAVAGKPIAVLMPDASITPPRLIAGLDRAQGYSFRGPETLSLMFDNLARELGGRAR